MPCGALYGVPSRRLTNIRSLLWCNTTPPISSRPCCCGTTFRPSLPSCCPGLLPSPFGRSGWRGGGATSHPSPSSRRGRFDPKQKAPAIVIGEVHHPVEAREIFSPSWLTIPERGLYTGVAIFGAVGSGKTSACMNPFARQLLGWQAGNPHLRAAALVLEVKGDFCHDIRQILVEAGRGQDYIELGMDARSQWNPLSAWWLDSYSLAYTVSSLLNQLFGKGKEPFWQQAYTNLVRWIIELHRVFPERWVTLQQVYRCAIDPELFAAKIEAAEKLSDDLNTGTVFVLRSTYKAQLINLAEWNWVDAPKTEGRASRLHALGESET